MSTRSFLSIFHTICQKYPQEAAIVENGYPISYGQLWKEIRQLAHEFKQKGVVSGQLIGICLPRSANWIRAMLATWMVDAAYVPLDPEWPNQRLESIIQDAGISHIIAPQIREISKVHSIQPVAKEFAYLIYTSGSTGKPKGVLIPHNGIVPFLEAQIEAFDMKLGDRNWWYLSPCFDASLSDIGTALLSGATLYIETNLPQTIDDIYDFLEFREITHWDLPPALLCLLKPPLPPCVHTLIIGGEACPVAVIHRWADRVRLINVYGPTEATVCSSLCQCTSEWEKPLLGVPLAGIRFLILDDHQQPLPTGTAGELAISGPGLAIGYHNQPDLSAQRFIMVDDQRYYLTGDRVVQHLHGSFEFMGRIDRQFKIRGRRIAPEEIEETLLSVSYITEAAVLKRPLVPGGSESLVAFVVGSFDPHILNTLKTRLPDWMRPQRLEWLPKLPRNANGKIDFEILSTIKLSTPCAPHGHGTPCPLQSVWEQVLGIQNISPNAHFFELGGHSLTVIECVALAANRGIYLSPDLLYQYPVLSCLNQVINDREAGVLTDTLREDVDELFERCSLQKRSSPPQKNMLLTGATGFLGARLLTELLLHTSAQIHCLVRASHIAQGRQRILKAIEPYIHQLSASHLTRLHPLLGDLTQPKLGSDRWPELAESIDFIYHCAARVNLVESYEQLKGCNVDGTSEILKLVANGTPKSLHYISTLSVLVTTDRQQEQVCEDDDLSGNYRIYGGYAQSKWAAEYGLRRAGVPMTIYRPGLITGDSVTGYSPPGDWLNRLTRGLIAMGIAPEMTALSLDMTPVDYAAKTIVAISLQQPVKKSTSTYHIANPNRLLVQDYLKYLQENHRVKIVSVPIWTKALKQSQHVSHSNVLLALCRCLYPSAFSMYRSLDMFQATDIVFDMENTLAALKGTDIHCPDPPKLLKLIV